MTALEFKLVPINDSKVATTKQVGSINGRSYRVLPRSEVPSNCCNVAKKWCSLLIYGVPYQPLSSRQVTSNYCRFSLAIAFALVSIYTEPREENLDLNSFVVRFGTGCLDCLAFGIGFVGVRELYKTYKAPRLDDTSSSYRE